MPKENEKPQTDDTSGAGNSGEQTQDKQNKGANDDAANAGGDGENNQDPKGSEAGDDKGQSEAEREEARLAGIRSQIGAEEQRLADLRLEKRTLNGNEAPKPQANDAGNGDDQGSSGAGDKDNPEVKRLQEQLSTQMQQLQQEAIKEFSGNTKYKLINPAHDANNANWQQMLSDNPIVVTPEDTKATITAKLSRAYYATFGERLEQEAAEAGRANGQADAHTANAADTGGGSGTDRSEKAVVLTPEQRAAAKKLGMTEDDYIKGLKLQNEQEAYLQ